MMKTEKKTGAIPDEASLCAVFCLVPYLDFEPVERDGISLFEVARQRRDAVRDRYNDKLYKAFCDALEAYPAIGGYRAGNVLMHTSLGEPQVSACVISGEGDNRFFVVYRGTNRGEWSDNALALTGDEMLNVWDVFDRRGRRRSVELLSGHASQRQVHALNYLRRVSAGLPRGAQLIVTGHSKGGNKAQFAALCSDAAARCYSFDGQGFSPEFLDEMRRTLGDAEFDVRRGKIVSIASFNDFVNVMGERAALAQNIRFLDSPEAEEASDHHLLCSILCRGELRGERGRGELSRLGENLWKRALASEKRVLAAMTLMSLCERIFGDGIPFNGEGMKKDAFYRGSVVSAGMFVASAFKTLLDSAKGEHFQKEPEDDCADNGDGSGVLARGVEIAKSALGELEKKLRGYLARGGGGNRQTDRYSLRQILLGSTVDRVSIDTDALSKRGAEIERALELLEQSAEEVGAFPARGFSRVLDDVADAAKGAADVALFLRESAKRFEETDSELAQIAGFIF